MTPNFEADLEFDRRVRDMAEPRPQTGSQALGRFPSLRH